MSAQTGILSLISARVRINLDKPRPLITSYGDREVAFTAGWVEWEHQLHDDGFDCFTVVAHGQTAPGDGVPGVGDGDLMCDALAWSSATVPEWVPRPPEGWDDAVTTLAAHR